MNWRPKRFRGRLLVALIGLLACVQGATFIGVTLWSRWTKMQEIAESLVRGVADLDRQTLNRVLELADKARLMAGDYALRQTLLLTDDSRTLASALESYLQRLGGPDAHVPISVVALITPEHAVMAQAGPRLAAHEVTAFLELVRRAESSEDAYPMANGNALVAGALHGLVVIPVFAPPPEIVAWLGYAFPIDGGFASDIKRSSRLELSFLSAPPDARLLASTLEDEQGAALLDPDVLTAVRAAAGRPESAVANIRIGRETFVTLAQPVSMIAGPAPTAVFQRSLDLELAPLRRLHLILFLGAAAGMVFAAGIAVQFARAVSDPVRRLAAHTRVIASGNYQVPVHLRGAEEFERLAGAFNAMTEGLAERDRVRDLLDKNVSPEIAAELMRSGSVLGGEEREITVLFSDLRGFTTLCESLAPREVVQLLNRYLTRMTAEIESEGGVVDKFIGDAIMAIFGAPVDQPDAPERAVRAAQRMRAVLVEFNDELAAEKRLPLSFGIGINTTRAIAGNIGSSRRLNYSVIGDGVNMTARLQALTRQPHFATDVIISAATASRLSSVHPIRPLGTVPVKGRHGQVEIFALTSRSGISDLRSQI